MGSHNGQVQELPPPLITPVNTCDEPLPVEETKRLGCPGCQLDEVNKASTSVPYRNFCFIWIICLTASASLSLFFFVYAIFYVVNTSVNLLAATCMD
jgi:hypothetical protein